MTDKIVVLDNYGPFKKGYTYQSGKQGPDWIQVKRNGNSYFLPINIVSRDISRFAKKEEVLEDYFDDNFFNEDY